MAFAMRDASCNDAYVLRDAMMPLGWLPGAEFRLTRGVHRSRDEDCGQTLGALFIDFTLTLLTATRTSQFRRPTFGGM